MWQEKWSNVPFTNDPSGIKYIGNDGHTRGSAPPYNYIFLFFLSFPSLLIPTLFPTSTAVYSSTGHSGETRHRFQREKSQIFQSWKEFNQSNQLPHVLQHSLSEGLEKRHFPTPPRIPRSELKMRSSRYSFACDIRLFSTQTTQSIQALLILCVLNFLWVFCPRPCLYRNLQT